MTDLIVAALLLVAVAWAGLLVRDLRTLPVAGVAGNAAASVSVVIPARDEEATLPALLESLRGLATRVLEVVVVDDGSRDATAAVARAAGTTVLPAGAPPAGWTGKAWACHVGAEATSGDLLLFLDADTILAPHALDGLLEMRGGHHGLVSVQPFHTVLRPYEQLSAYFNAVAVLASGAFRHNPRGRAMAFGPCLLTSRVDYERVGGHSAVRGEILDDVQLAGAYQRADLPVRCAIGGCSMQMRSYPGGIQQLSDGWTKNIASGATAAAPGPALGTVGWVAAQHAVAVGAGLAVVGVLTGHELAVASGSLVLWAIAWVVLAWQLRSMLRRLGSFRWWTWVLFPVPLLAFDAIFVRSLAQTVVRRSVRWRGRDVRLDRRRSVGKST